MTKLLPNEIMNDEASFKATASAILSRSAIKNCHYSPNKCL